MNKMVPFIKKALKVTLWVVIGYVFLLMVLAVFIQIPAVQNKIVHVAVSSVSNKTHTRVEIKKINLSISGSLVIKNFFLDDLQKDTLLYAGGVKLRIALKDLFFSKINIKHFELKDININVNRPITDSLFNFNFLLTAFGDTVDQKGADKPTKSKWGFDLKKVILKNTGIHYDDQYGGVNLAARFKLLELKMDEVDLARSIYSADKLSVDNLFGEALVKNPVHAKISKKSAGTLPKISVGNFQIKNSSVNFGDSINKQSVIAFINLFELKGASVDLQQEKASAGKLSLLKSQVLYAAGNKTVLPGTSHTRIPAVKEKSGWVVSVKRVEINDNSLAYAVANKTAIKDAFDPNHFDFKHLTLAAKDFNHSPLKTEATVKKITVLDQNNFSITGFETNFKMDQHSIFARNLKVATPNSTLDANLSIQFSSLASLKDSLQNISLDIDMKRISLLNSDILYFSPKLAKQPFFDHKTNRTTLSGTITGQVKDLKGKDVLIETGEGSILRADFNITGLPDVETAFFDFPNLEILSRNQDIEMIAGPYLPQTIELPGNIALHIAFRGMVRSFVSTLEINSSFGSAQVSANIDKNENFTCNLNINNFDVGKLLKDTMMFGPVSLTAKAQGHGLDKETVMAKINTEVSRARLNNYTYHHLNLDGRVSGQEFNGKIKLNDVNAALSFEGLVNLNPGMESYLFRLNVEGADLKKLNFTKEDIRISLVATADLKGGALDKLNGGAKITNMVIAKGDEIFDLDSVLFATVNEKSKSEFNVSSAILAIKYSGTISPMHLKPGLNHFVNRYFNFNDSIQTESNNELSNFSFEAQLHNHPLLPRIMPQLKEFGPGVILGSFDSEKGELKLNTEMKKIVYGAIEINDMAIVVNSGPAAMNYSLSCQSVSSAQIKLVNFLCEGKLAGQAIFANLSSIADNQDKNFVVHSQITKDNNHYRLAVDPEDFYFMHNRWDIAGDNYIAFGKKGFLIHHLYINKDESHINISSVNDQFKDDLNIAIKNFRLDDLSRVIEKDTGMVKGNVNGNILLKRVDNSYGIVADAGISNLVVHDVPVGNLTLKADNPTAGTFDIDARLSGTDNQLTAKGYYTPESGSGPISIKADIQSLSMKTIEAFSMGQISGASGNLSGNLLMQGSAAAPEITGELVFHDVLVNPSYLNNRVELKNESLQFKPDGIYFKSFTLLDANKQTAIIDGSIKMKAFKDLIFALQVNTKGFELFNTTSIDHKEFFGRMVIDSRIDINGPMALPDVNAKIKVKNGSNFTFAVPESRLTTYKGGDVVEFTTSSQLNPILYREEDEITQQTAFKGINLASIIEIDKGATLRLLMDPSATDSLVVRGEAALSFTMDRSGKMSLAGAYNLNEGSYLVSLESLLKRRFDIIPGSAIIWNGDPLDAIISINAKYAVRAAPYDLMPFEVSSLSDAEQGSYKQRYPFWVLLKLRGEILHPVISFEIQLPPAEKGILSGAVDQKLGLLNEDESALNKQVFALLVLGRFIQENPLQTESGGTSTFVRATVGKLLSAQLNQLSSQVIPGMELNFDIQSYEDYQTGQAEGRTQVEIGVKKHLFKDRMSVQVGGSVDVEGESAKQNSASDITSDVHVEYKITKDGRLRLKGFRYNQYEGAIEGQLVETGAGIAYVRDFNNWRDFFVRFRDKNKMLKDNK